MRKRSFRIVNEYFQNSQDYRFFSCYLGWGSTVLLYAGETQDLGRTDGDMWHFVLSIQGVSMATVLLFQIPAVKLYWTWKPNPSSSSSLKKRIHMKRPLERTSPGLVEPQKRLMIGEKLKGPSRTSMWSKRHSKEASM